MEMEQGVLEYNQTDPLSRPSYLGINSSTKVAWAEPTDVGRVNVLRSNKD